MITPGFTAIFLGNDSVLRESGVFFFLLRQEDHVACVDVMTNCGMKPNLFFAFWEDLLEKF